jgi:hypothetical protein
MKAGDILLVKTKYDPISWLIRKVTNSNYNHACIAFNGKILINIRAKGMELINVNKYKLSKYHECKLLRMEKFDKRKINNVLSYLLLHDFKRFYIYWLWQGLMFLIAKKPLKNSCSGLIAEAFHYNGHIFSYTDDYNITPEDINRCIGMTNVTEEL